MAIETPGVSSDVDMRLDRNNLYREETVSDLEGRAIRRLIPISDGGGVDPARSEIFFGSIQVMTPQGPLPVQARLMANNLSEAIDDFPATMKKALDQLVVELEKMQAESESRIITPGR